MYINDLQFPPGKTIIGWLLGDNPKQCGLTRLEIEGARVALRGRGTLDGSDHPMHILVTCKNAETLRRVEQKIKEISTEANAKYRQDGEVWASPRTKEEFLFNLHVLATINKDLLINDIGVVYKNHFKHAWQPEKFMTISQGGILGALQKFPHLFEQYPLQDETTFCVRSCLHQAATLQHLVFTHRAHRDRKKDLKRRQNDQRRGSSKRKKGEPILERPNDSVMSSALKAIHQTIWQASRETAMPISFVELEFNMYWRVPLDTRTLGQPSMLHFLLRFPKVFKVATDGLEPRVAAIPEPDFDLAHENKEEMKDVKDLAMQAGEDMVGIVADMVAERNNKKYVTNPLVRDIARICSGAAPVPYNLDRLLDKLTNPNAR